MANESNLPGADILADTKAMIDGLKTVCANAGLANDSSEYKIITEAFLYKFLNDKFLHELRKLDKFKDAADVEAAYSAMDEDEREFELVDLPAGTAVIRPEFLIPYLFNRKNKDGFAELFDGALTGISDDNVDVFSVKTGQGQSIRLFSGVSRFILEEGKRDNFCEKLITKLASFSFERAFDKKYDFFAAVFEYLISDYNKDSGTYGEFFTPHSIATIIARILVPDGAKDVTVYDPAAGTGTLVLAAAHRIGEDKCTIYTQDRSQKANEFMRLNLILNNLVHSLPNVVNDDTLVSPRHLDANGKSLRRFDFVVSNPPFNCDFSDVRDQLAGEKYRKRFWLGVPNIPSKDLDSMPIYQMFLQHIVQSMNDKGKAAIVVPTGFLSISKGIGRKFRQFLIEKNMLDGVIKMPPMVFANTGTRVSVLFLDKNRSSAPVLLMDATDFGKKIIVDGDTQRTILSDSDISSIVHLYQSRKPERNISVAVNIDGFNDDYSFSPGHYFVPDIKFYDYDRAEFLEEIGKTKRSIDALLNTRRSIDDAVIAVRELVAAYEKYADMLFDQWFVKFNYPKGSLDETLQRNDYLEADIPIGWSVKNIQEVCSVIDCLHSKKPNYCLESVDKFLLTLENVTPDGFIDLKKKFYVSDEDYEIWTQRAEVMEGDFVVTNAGRAGCIARIPTGIRCGISRNLTAIKPKKISSLFMRQYFRSFWFKKQVATSLDEGSFFLSYNVKSIKRIMVLVPPKSLIEDYEHEVEGILKDTAICTVAF